MGQHKFNPTAIAARNGLLGKKGPEMSRQVVNINLDSCAGYHCPNCMHDKFMQEYVLREGSALILGESKLIQAHTGFICINCGWSGKAVEMNKLTPEEARELEKALTNTAAENAEVPNAEEQKDIKVRTSTSA